MIYLKIKLDTGEEVATATDGPGKWAVLAELVDVLKRNPEWEFVHGHVICGDAERRTVAQNVAPGAHPGAESCELAVLLARELRGTGVARSAAGEGLPREGESNG